ncbi:hypothetical protein [Candidatus Neomicrothrix sp.]|uniref:hypothetical protein n=1 Tax=Candidatus Neomicrothrix sp. TaxID=2719034 RepID=UPI002598CC25|nr:hypothetical protein [Candidatus Microthrix sp.]HMS47025.1 hypothetical protein [Candidatus Microthrix sp.]
MDDTTPALSPATRPSADEAPSPAPAGHSRLRAWAFRAAFGAAVWGAMVGIWGVGPWRAVIAVIAIGLLLFPGIAMARSVATPLPPPPDPGTLRKVKLVYRCSLCSTEVRMTAALEEDPEPPRHCMEDMDLITPKE